MQTLSEIRQLLAERGLTPKHRLGQNFLHDKNQIAKLIDAAAITPGELVLEVGPGTGTLTEALLERGANVIAVELDAGLAELIESRLGENEQLTLICGDALHKQRGLNPQVVAAIGDRAFKLVANLPYQIASSLMTTLLIDHSPDCVGRAKPQAAAGCVGQFITIQKEVAERLMAKPSTKAYGPLSIIVQALADVERIATLSPSCFWPPPEVTSAMVAIRPTMGTRPPFSAAHERMGTRPLFSREERRDFARFITGLFTKRRKQLGSTFGRNLSDWPAGISADQRPEALTVEQMIALWHWRRETG